MFWRPRSLRLRYTLRALLLITTLVAVWCAFHANRGRSERNMERELTLAGATVDSGLDRITGEPRRATTYERFLRFAFAQRFIRSVRTQHKVLAPELIDRVWRLPHLESAVFLDCKLTNDHLRSLSMATKLNSLHLTESGLTDDGLQGLESLTQLCYVHISKANVGDATLERLATLPELEAIELWGVSITGRGVKSLSCRHVLTRFSGNDSPIHNDFLATLSECRTLRQLELVRTNISDEGVAHFRNHPSLQIVELGASNLTDASLAIAATIPQLKQFTVTGQKMTKRAFQDFQSRRPEVRL